MTLIASRYEIQAQIGVGAVGTVFRALDTQVEQIVALKLLKPEAVANDPDMVERFAREAEILKQLDHPHIVKVLDIFEDNHQHYIVMEYVGGGSLRDLLLENPQLPVKRALEIAIDLVDALIRTHRMRIIHRDIKPANILIAEDGTIRLSDFGVARFEIKERMTVTGSAVGTLDYMPPEALNGEEIDARVDIWSFGVTLFEMLTGRRPFHGETVTQVLIGIMTQPPARLEDLRPESPLELIHLVYQLLEKDPNARLDSIRKVGSALEDILKIVDEKGVHKKVSDTSSNPYLIIPQHNLPESTQISSARESEVPELAALLDKPTVRLITMTGAAEASKSSLAVRAAWKHLTHFPHGVFCVDLKTLDTTEDILENLTTLLEFELRDDMGMADQVVEFIKRKTMLLIFEGGDRPMNSALLVIRRILQTAPGIKVIVLAVEPLKLDGEVVFDPDYVARKKAADMLNTGIENYKKMGVILPETAVTFLEEKIKTGMVTLSPEEQELWQISRRKLFQRQLMNRVLMVVLCSFALIIPSLLINTTENPFVIALTVTTFGIIVNSVNTVLHTIMEYLSYSRLKRIGLFSLSIAISFGLLLMIIHAGEVTTFSNSFEAFGAGFLVGLFLGLSLQLSIPSKRNQNMILQLRRSVVVGLVVGLVISSVVFFTDNSDDPSISPESQMLEAVLVWIQMPALIITFAASFNAGIALGDKMMADMPVLKSFSSTEA